MKWSNAGFIAALLITLCHGFAFADGNANFILGHRVLDDDATWKMFSSDVDEQPVIGANIDFGESNWPVRLAVGIHASGESDSAANVDAGILDLSFGVRFVGFPSGRTHPYAGVGVSHVFATLDSDDLVFAEDDLSDSSFGVYANGGIYWNIGDRLNVGFDARWLQGTDIDFRRRIPGTPVVVEDFNTDADYFQVGMLVGLRWGAGSSSKRRPPADSQPVR